MLPYWPTRLIISVTTQHLSFACSIISSPLPCQFVEVVIHVGTLPSCLLKGIQLSSQAPQCDILNVIM